MQFFQRLRKATAFFFLIAFLAVSFAAIAIPAEGKATQAAGAEKYFSLPTATALMVREEASASSVSTQVEKQHSQLMHQWQAASLRFEYKFLCRNELIPLSGYNPFYIVITIHAP